MLLALFSLFAKDQVGGDREILTQQITLRLILSLMEDFFASLGSIFKEDMVSVKDRLSHQVGLEKELRRTATAQSSFNLFVSYNTDTSKCSPSFLVHLHVVGDGLADASGAVDVGGLEVVQREDLRPARVHAAQGDGGLLLNTDAIWDFIRDSVTVDPVTMAFLSGDGAGDVVLLHEPPRARQVQLGHRPDDAGDVGPHHDQGHEDQDTPVDDGGVGRRHHPGDVDREELQRGDHVAQGLGLGELRLEPALQPPREHVEERVDGDGDRVQLRNRRQLTMLTKFTCAVFQMIDMSSPFEMVKQVYSSVAELFRRGASLLCCHHMLYIIRIWAIDLLCLRNVMEELTLLLNVEEEKLPMVFGLSPSTTPWST